jgi:ribose 5-phosphate isomerase RpiB
MKIAIGSDHTGLALKEVIKAYLDSRMIPYEDLALTHRKVVTIRALLRLSAKQSSPQSLTAAS